MKSFKKYLLFCLLGLIAILGAVFLIQQDEPSVKKCHGVENLIEKEACWKKAIDEDLKRGDLDQTMQMVAGLYDTEPEFARNCHDFMHSIGKSAYELFSKGKSFKIGDKTGYCAYGFYHGFMENLVSRSGDIGKARDFCATVDRD